MRTMKIVVIVLLIAAVMNWMRDGEELSILESLPIIGGYEPGIYDVGAVVLFFITLWGVRRLASRRQRPRG